MLTPGFMNSVYDITKLATWILMTAILDFSRLKFQPPLVFMQALSEFAAGRVQNPIDKLDQAVCRPQFFVG